MRKTRIYTEAAYALGLILLAFGTAFMAYGGFGISMVAAPGYILYLKLSPTLPFFTFGTAGYFVEALVLLGMMLIIKRARFTYLFSFVTAVLYGLLLDAVSLLTALFPADTLLQLVLYVCGMLLCSCAISLLLLSYFPPAAHEMFVKEVSAYKNRSLGKLKTAYDCTALALTILLSLLFFGDIRGIGLGTVICAFVNGFCIRTFSDLFKNIFDFRDAFPARHRFEERKETL